jgi:hypothetical protein
MTTTFLDHITITAPTLEAGAALLHNALVVTPQTGGEHPRMGTHNRLLRLGPALFLEVIAPNPAAPAPNRPRWFSLDHLQPDSPPALSAWVVRTNDISASAAAASEDLGLIEPMSRGHLNWHITIPPDGSLPMDGAAPALIEWHTDNHPAAGMPDLGLWLAHLTVFHPEPDRIRRLLASLNLSAPVNVLPPAPGTRTRLAAVIGTPHGFQMLGD